MEKITTSLNTYTGISHARDTKPPWSYIDNPVQTSIALIHNSLTLRMGRNESNSSSCCPHLENSQNELYLLDVTIFTVSAVKET